MITQLPLLIVSLLVAVTQATEFEYKIEPDRCKDDTACFVRKKCIDEFKDEVNAENVLFDYTDAALVDEKCDVFVQIKAINLKKYLVLMEVVDSIKPDNGIVIEQNGVSQMSCTDAALTGNADWKFEYKGSSPNPRTDSNKMFCSFLVTAIKQDDSEITDSFRSATLDATFPQLVFSKSDGTKVEVKYDGLKDEFWKKPKKICDGDKVKPVSSNNDYILEEVDTSLMKLTCTGKFLVKHDVDPPFETTDAFCDPSSKLWSWGAAPEQKHRPGKSLEISCIKKKFCTSCDDLPQVTTCADCENDARTSDTSSGCSAFTCPNGKWTIDGQTNLQTILAKQVICQKTASGDSKWFIHHKGDGDQGDEILAGASCRSVVECSIDSYTVDKCPDGVTCDGVPTLKDGNITCPNGAVLKGNEGSLVNPIPSRDTCNKANGEWNNLSTDEPVYCAKEAVAAPSTGGDSSMLSIVGGIIAAIVIIVAIVLVVCKVVVPRMKKGKGAAHGGATSKKTGKLSSKKSSEKSKSKSGDLKKSDSDPIEKQADEDKAKPAADAAGTPATPAGDKPPPTTDIEGLKTDKDGKTDPPTPSNPKVPPTPSPAAPAGALPV